MTEDMLSIVPIGECIAADVVDFDLNTLTDDSFDVLREALWQHLVLRFRNQEFDDHAHLALNARFGDLDYTPPQLIGAPHREPDPPFMETVSNILEDGEAIGSLGNDELVWHSDMAFLKRPYGVSILRAVELPPAGGDTSFANMFRALETLPDDLRKAIDGRKSLQDGFLNDRTGNKPRLDPNRPRVEGQYDGTGAEHPFIRTHPETGRHYLYLGRRPRSSVIGMAESDSVDLLDALWEHATKPELIWTHHWRLGDVILWDNRCTMHHRTPFDPACRRILRRTATRGELTF